jgi:hypothetical protein
VRRKQILELIGQDASAAILDFENCTISDPSHFDVNFTRIVAQNVKTVLQKTRQCPLQPLAVRHHHRLSRRREIAGHHNSTTIEDAETLRQSCHSIGEIHPFRLPMLEGHQIRERNSGVLEAFNLDGDFAASLFEQLVELGILPESRLIQLLDPQADRGQRVLDLVGDDTG